MPKELLGVLFTVIVMGGCVLFYLATRTEEDKKRDALVDKPSGDIVPLDDLPLRHTLQSGAYQAKLIRQSGNIYRELGVFPSAEAALREGMKSLRRAQVTHVRITHSDADAMAAYRHIYNFRGRAEGKKLAGIVIERVAEN